MRRGLIAPALLAGAIACASASPPPGGAEDLAPPRLLAVTPDSNAVNVRDERLHVDRHAKRGEPFRHLDDPRDAGCALRDEELRESGITAIEEAKVARELGLQMADAGLTFPVVMTRRFGDPIGRVARQGEGAARS